MGKKSFCSIVVNGIEYITKAEFSRRTKIDNSVISVSLLKRNAPCYLINGRALVIEAELSKWIKENTFTQKTEERHTITCSKHVARVLKKVAGEGNMSISKYLEKCFGHMEE